MNSSDSTQHSGGELRTPRLLGVPINEHDQDLFLCLGLDPQVTALVGDGSPWSRERAVSRFQGGLAACQAGTAMWWVLRQWPATNSESHTDFVGFLVTELSDAEVEVGIWLAPHQWSRGYASEAVRSAVPLLRSRFPDAQVVGYVAEHHHASHRMLAGAGFHPDGQRTGRYGDTVIRHVHPDTSVG